MSFVVEYSDFRDGVDEPIASGSCVAEVTDPSWDSPDRKGWIELRVPATRGDKYLRFRLADLIADVLQ